MSPNPAALRLEQLTEAVAARVVNEVLEAIDVNALLGRVDVEGVIDRVDVEKIIERVDVEGIVKRIDVNAIVAEIDIDSLVENTELGSLIVKSTAGILTDILDGVRAQGVALDDFCAKLTDRILRRNPASLPLGPDHTAPGSEVSATSTPIDGLTTRPPPAKGSPPTFARPHRTSHQSTSVRPADRRTPRSIRRSSESPRRNWHGLLGFVGNLRRGRRVGNLRG